MTKELRKEMAERLGRVTLRLTALDKERVELEEEQRYLTELEKVYNKRTYDPIEEERRVTMMLGNDEELSTKDAVRRSIYSFGNKPFKMSEVKQRAEKLLGNEINYGSLTWHVNKLIDEGELSKDDRYYMVVES